MTTSTDHKPTLISYISLALLAFIWGSSFILIKKSIVEFNPYEVASFRISISGIAFLPLMIYYWNEIEWHRWYMFLLIGLIGTGIPAVLFSIGQTEISSSVSGILNSLTPIFAFFVGILFFHARFVWLKLIGIFLSFSGAVLLVIQSSPSEGSTNIVYSLFLVLATLLYGININMIKKFFQDTKALILSSVSLVLISPPAIIYLLAQNSLDRIVVDNKFSSSFISVTTLALLSTVLATVIFFKLVQQTSAVFASTVAFLAPIVAILWGVLDGEMIGMWHFFGMLMILGGVYLIKR